MKMHIAEAPGQPRFAEKSQADLSTTS